jgi:hypothetical protein
MSAYIQTRNKIRRWLLRKLPTCKQTVQVISESMERTLSWRERVLVKLHLWVCMWCQWYLEHLQLLHTSLRTAAESDSTISTSPGLSAEARERIKRNLTGPKTGNL